MTTKQITIASENDLKKVLAKDYQKQIKNFMGNDKDAMRFLSGVISATQMTPKLLQCEPFSLINSFMQMAQLQLMPSGVSGEAYVLPYGKVAQFQLGYQGYITLFYRAGVQSIRSEIVREEDEFNYENGKVYHKIDLFKPIAKRGKAIGCYVIAKVNGEEIVSAMNGEDIMAHGKKFSKSFDSDYSPWNEKNDPELWMWKKTVVKQIAKLLPKNETINKAIAMDNGDSVLSKPKTNANSRLAEAQASTNLNMGNYAKETAKESEIEVEVAESNEGKKSAK